MLTSPGVVGLRSRSSLFSGSSFTPIFLATLTFLPTCRMCELMAKRKGRETDPGGSRGPTLIRYGTSGGAPGVGACVGWSFGSPFFSFESKPEVGPAAYGNVSRNALSLKSTPSPSGSFLPPWSSLTTHEKYQREAQQAAERIATARKNNTKVEENDVREVSAFVIKQMKRKVEAGANATSRPSKTVSSTPPAKPVRLAETPEEKVNKEEREDQKFNR